MDSRVMQELDGSGWNHIRPDLCPCGGLGWLVSDFDTLHRCQMHGQGVPSPEEDSTGFDWTEHKLAMWRQAYRIYRAQIVDDHLATPRAFRAMCEERLDMAILADNVPRAWTQAAHEVADKLMAEKAERNAHRAGFSCALEANLYEEALMEQAERMGF